MASILRIDLQTLEDEYSDLKADYQASRREGNTARMQAISREMVEVDELIQIEKKLS